MSNEVKRHFSKEAADWPIEAILAHPHVSLQAVHTWECPQVRWANKRYRPHICNCGAAEIQHRIDAYRLELARDSSKRGGVAIAPEVQTR